MLGSEWLSQRRTGDTLWLGEGGAGVFDERTLPVGRPVVGTEVLPRQPRHDL